MKLIISPNDLLINENEVALLETLSPVLFQDTDKCGLEHAQCPLLIIFGAVGRTCECEETFRQCLRRSKKFVTHLAGIYYFDRLAADCFTFQEVEDCDGEVCRVIQLMERKRVQQF